MAVSEGDVVNLSKTETWAVKSMVRPDTSRIGAAFDEMMARVKVREKHEHFVYKLKILAYDRPWLGADCTVRTYGVPR